jgi:hypothetical protein
MTFLRLFTETNSKILNALLSKSKFNITLYGVDTSFTFNSVDFVVMNKILSKLMRKYEIINAQVDLQHVHIILARADKRIYITIKFY